MNIHIYPEFVSAINEVKHHLRRQGNHLDTESWQGMKQPPTFYEVLNVSFSALMPQQRIEAEQQIKPNIEWCLEHFMERVGGKPLNPGKSFKNWPYYKTNPKNDTSRGTDGKFSHTYMERIWPKNAGEDHECGTECNEGIRYILGDLNTLMEVIKKEPFTRQAYLPIWFPEDSEAIMDNQRVPCTLGYHFIRRGNQFHVTYYIRSCDFFRHFRDDIYLTYRLAEHILTTLRANDYNTWAPVSLGIFTMHIVSLHIFSKEYNLLND